MFKKSFFVKVHANHNIMFCVQCLLVRWLLVTYDLLDSTEGLHSLYSFLFYFLENDIMVQLGTLAILLAFFILLYSFTGLNFNATSSIYH